jgi:hypothetical protein
MLDETHSIEFSSQTQTLKLLRGTKASFPPLHSQYPNVHSHSSHSSSDGLLSSLHEKLTLRGKILLGHPRDHARDLDDDIGQETKARTSLRSTDDPSQTEAALAADAKGRTQEERLSARSCDCYPVVLDKVETVDAWGIIWSHAFDADADNEEEENAKDTCHRRCRRGYLCVDEMTSSSSSSVFKAAGVSRGDILLCVHGQQVHT